MLTNPPTPEDILRWREIASEYRPRLTPNRRSADEITSYLKSRYPVSSSDDPRLHDVVAQNILLNEFSARKLPPDTPPETRVFLVCNEGSGTALYTGRDPLYGDSPIIVGLEDHTRFFLVEGSSALHDELTAFAGLDADDLENYFLVAQYIECLRMWRPEDTILWRD